MENALWNKLLLFSDTLIRAIIYNCEGMWYIFVLCYITFWGGKTFIQYHLSIPEKKVNICCSSKQLLQGILFEEGIITEKFGED